MIGSILFLSSLFSFPTSPWDFLFLSCLPVLILSLFLIYICCCVILWIRSPAMDTMAATPTTPSNGCMTKRGFPLMRNFLTSPFSLPTCCTPTVKGIKNRQGLWAKEWFMLFFQVSSLRKSNNIFYFYPSPDVTLPFFQQSCQVEFTFIGEIYHSCGGGTLGEGMPYFFPPYRPDCLGTIHIHLLF